MDILPVIPYGSSDCCRHTAMQYCIANIGIGFLNQAGTWFFEITFLWTSPCVFVLGLKQMVNLLSGYPDANVYG